MKTYLFCLGILIAAIGTSHGQPGSEENPQEPPPGFWQIPKTQFIFKVGGYVKLDVIHDFDPIGSPDFFNVWEIPTDGSKGETTHLNVKETRLLFDTRHPSRFGELRVYLESDFYGTNGAFRIRHAFLEIGGRLLAGQYWSNFMDPSIIPGTLDFEKPAAYAFVRHPMIRWKQPFGENLHLSLAIEEPSSKGIAPMKAGKFESPLPDFTAALRYESGWGHVQLSGFAGTIRYRFDTGGNANYFLAGGNLSGQLNFWEKDKFTYQMLYGPGTNRYRGGNSVAPATDSTLQAITDLAFTLGYTHFWIPELSSLAVFNHGIIENTPAEDAGNPHTANYFAVNLLWHYIEGGFIGLEYLRGHLEDFSGATGTANRLQLSFRYSFNL